MCAAAGITVSATITDPIRQKVLVKASGLKSLPSGPVMDEDGQEADHRGGNRGEHGAATSLDAR